MNLKKHLTLIGVSFLIWGAFYLIGLSSDYFLNWSTAEKMLITRVGLFAIFPLICPRKPLLAPALAGYFWRLQCLGTR